MVEKLNYDIGDQICFDQIMMMAGKEFTVLGRPLLTNAKVFATVEQQCLTEKIIVFKKKRRKGYKRNMGSRQAVTMLRIERVEYILDEQTMSAAVSLI